MNKQPLLIRFVYKAPVFLIGFAGFIYATSMVVNYREDTTNISIASFVIMMSLAAISFSFARVVETEELKDRIMFAGERILHGAILVLVASVLKFFIFVLIKNPIIATSVTLETALKFTVGLLVAIIFSNGVLFAHTGLRVLNDLLLLRLTRHKDWDDLW